MNITAADYTEEMVGAMVSIYLIGQVSQRWGEVKMEEDKELYRNAQTGELRLGNPDS